MDQTVQIALSIGVPTLAVLIGILINNSRLSDLRANMDSLRSHMDARFDLMEKYMDARFGEAKAELLRVEGVRL